MGDIEFLVLFFGFIFLFLLIVGGPTLLGKGKKRG